MKNQINLNKEEEILHIVTNNPTSVRRISTICDQSKSTVWNVLETDISISFSKSSRITF